MSLLIWLIALVLVSIGIALQIVLTYYPLKALAHILRILMEFEYSSRGVMPVISDIKAFRREHPLDGESLREMIEEGRE